ncbi:MAG: amino acid ABC transporter permease, partial [Treponema sp.]|nr:amino acid ABC transporter permease [Treponema sp.]
MFELDFMLSAVPEIIQYIPITVLMALVSCLIGCVLGILLALARFFNVRFLSRVIAVYVSFIRGTPMLVQLYLVYYGLPLLVKSLVEATGGEYDPNAIPKIVYAFTAFSLNSAAYMSETFRSALEAVDKGQMEACYSIHMTTFQALRRVILPQAFEIALPPLGNSLLALVKDTSLAFSISIVDLMAGAKIMASRSFRFFEIYIVVSFIYWAICFVLERLIALAEKKLKRQV